LELGEGHPLSATRRASTLGWRGRYRSVLGSSPDVR
jgi:hypothetical protein